MAEPFLYQLQFFSVKKKNERLCSKMLLFKSHPANSISDSVEIISSFLNLELSSSTPHHAVH